MHLNRETLSTMLQGPLPGEHAQMKLAPESRVGPYYSEPAEDDAGRRRNGEEGNSDNCRSAAVLILLYPDKDLVRTVFMKRNEYDGPHSGQISFPGGMYEESDQDLMYTALRETEEETGVEAKKIELLGKLTPLYIPVSNFCVTPYIAWLPEKPEFYPDSSEVQYLLTPSLDELRNPANQCMEILHRHGRDIKVPGILLGQDIIWGATAMILSEFMELIDR